MVNLIIGPLLLVLCITLLPSSVFVTTSSRAAIVYAAGLGGLTSPLGGAMNLVTVDYLQQLTGKEYMYSSWVIRFLPIMLVLAVSNILFMIRDIKKGETLGGTKEYFVEQFNSMPKMSFEEKASLILFILATALSFTRQFYQKTLPGLGLTGGFVTVVVIISLTLLLSDENSPRGQVPWQKN